MRGEKEDEEGREGGREGKETRERRREVKQGEPRYTYILCFLAINTQSRTGSAGGGG